MSSRTFEMRKGRLTQDRVESATLLMSPRGLQVLTQWAQLWADKRLDPAFTESWLQAKVIGGDRGGGKARPIAFEEMLLKMVTSSTLRAHVSQVWRATGAHQFGIYHEGGAPEIAWKIHAKMAAEPTKVFVACDIKNGFGAARRRDAIDGAKRWCPVLGTVFVNLWAGKQGVQLTAWTNTPKGCRPIAVTSAGCVRGSSGVCAGSEGGHEGIRRRNEKTRGRVDDRAGILGV